MKASDWIEIALIIGLTILPSIAYLWSCVIKPWLKKKKALETVEDNMLSEGMRLGKLLVAVKNYDDLARFDEQFANFRSTYYYEEGYGVIQHDLMVERADKAQEMWYRQMVSRFTQTNNAQL